MSLPALHIGELTARIPIIQGGMGIGISLSGLAGAVAKEGGIAFIYGSQSIEKQAQMVATRLPLTAGLLHAI